MSNDTPAPVESAWHDFKGSTERATIPDAQTVVDAVETARTTQWRAPSDNSDRMGETVPAVDVYLSQQSEVPQAVQDIAERHGLVEADRDLRGGMVDSVTYIRSEDEP